MTAGLEWYQRGRTAVESASGSAFSMDWQVAKPMVDSNKINPRKRMKNFDMLNSNYTGR